MQLQPDISRVSVKRNGEKGVQSNHHRHGAVRRHKSLASSIMIPLRHGDPAGDQNRNQEPCNPEIRNAGPARILGNTASQMRDSGNRGEGHWEQAQGRQDVLRSDSMSQQKGQSRDEKQKCKKAERKVRDRRLGGEGGHDGNMRGVRGGGGGRGIACRRDGKSIVAVEDVELVISAEGAGVFVLAA